MKKNYLYSAAVVATLALASCSSSDVIDVTDEAQASGQVLEIAVENAGNGLESRSGRPLYSSEAAQDIDNVKVVVVETAAGGTKKVVAEELITDWMNSNKVINYDDASGHGRKIRIELTGDNAFTKENGATYKVYAIGYSDDTNYKVGTSSLGTYLNGITKTSSTTDLENLALINQAEDPNKAEEIFAGSADITFSSATSGSSKFSQGVTLHRQVAGVFTYVKNIPYMFGANGTVGTKLQLVASTINKNLILGNYYDKTLANNGNKENEAKNILKNVVNGTSPRGGSEQVIYTINLSDWFTKLQDVNNDGFLDRYGYKQDENGKLVENTAEQIWKNPFRSGQTASATFVKGSVFGGEFIIPFMKTDGKTFELRMVDDNGTTVRSWSISLPETDFVSGANLSYWNTNAWATTAAEYADTKDAYSVLRNHLYGVGTKTSADPDTDGKNPDPEEPTPDTDDPQDLNTKQDIMLQVNDNWEVIHQMVVE